MLNDTTDPLAPARGALLAATLGSALWAALIAAALTLARALP